MNTSLHVRWPAERFYWSVVEASAWRRCGPAPEVFRQIIEEQSPCEPGELHTVCAPLDEHRVVVCAAERSELASLGAGTLTLTPESLPPCIEGVADPLLLNLLVGEFEPLLVRRSRWQRHLTAATIVLLCGLLVGTGLARRASYWTAVAGSAEAEAEAVLKQAGGLKETTLSAEVARLRKLASGLRPARPEDDASLALAELLRSWPAAVPSMPQSLAISRGAASISVSVEGDPAPFLRAFVPPSGWRLDEPRLNSTDRITRLSLNVRREVNP